MTWRIKRVPRGSRLRSFPAEAVAFMLSRGARAVFMAPFARRD